MILIMRKINRSCNEDRKYSWYSTIPWTVEGGYTSAYGREISKEYIDHVRNNKIVGIEIDSNRNIDISVDNIMIKSESTWK